MLVRHDLWHLKKLPRCNYPSSVSRNMLITSLFCGNGTDIQGFTCAIEFRGRIVGVAGYHPIRWNNKSVEIGYWLAREAVGHGIMTKCCRVLISHAFAVYGLNRVQIPAAVGNRRSRAIPERLGFTWEGVIRDAEWLYDHFVDHAMYSILSRDWGGEQQGDGYLPPAAGSSFPHPERLAPRKGTEG